MTGVATCPEVLPEPAKAPPWAWPSGLAEGVGRPPIAAIVGVGRAGWIWAAAIVGDGAICAAGALWFAQPAHNSSARVMHSLVHLMCECLLRHVSNRAD